MNFKEMTLLQLKAYAKEKGIRGVSTLKKNQLIERIIASENKSIQTKAEESIKSEKNTTSENGIKTEKNCKIIYKRKSPFDCKPKGIFFPLKDRTIYNYCKNISEILQVVRKKQLTKRKCFCIIGEVWLGVNYAD